MDYESEIAELAKRHPQYKIKIEHQSIGHFYNGTDTPEWLMRLPCDSDDFITGKRGDKRINIRICGKPIVKCLADSLRRQSQEWKENPQSVFGWVRHESQEMWTDSIILVTRRNSRLLGLPGGKIERGESPRVALAREIQEETGIEKASLEIGDEVFRGIAHGKLIVVYTAETDMLNLSGNGVVPIWGPPSKLIGKAGAFRRINGLVLSAVSSLEKAELVRKSKSAREERRAERDSEKWRREYPSGRGDGRDYVPEYGPRYDPAWAVKWGSGCGHADDCCCGDCRLH